MPSFLPTDAAALKAGLNPHNLVIREFGQTPLADVGGTFRVRGAYKLSTLTTDTWRIRLTNDDPDALLVATLTFPRDAAGSLGTPHAVSGAGLSVSGTPFYWLEDDTVRGFNAVFVLPASAGSGNIWHVTVDPLVTSTISNGDPLILPRLWIERTA